MDTKPGDSRKRRGCAFGDAVMDGCGCLLVGEALFWVAGIGLAALGITGYWTWALGIGVVALLIVLAVQIRRKA